MGINQVNPIGRESIKPLNLIWPRRLWQRKKWVGLRRFSLMAVLQIISWQKHIIKVGVIASAHQQHCWKAIQDHLDWILLNVFFFFFCGVLILHEGLGWSYSADNSTVSRSHLWGFWQEQSYLPELLSGCKHPVAELQQMNAASSSASDSNRPDGRTIVSCYQQRDADEQDSRWVQ